MKSLNLETQITSVKPAVLKATVGLEMFGAIGGLAGGLPFLLDPSGKTMNSSVSVLANTPISDFFPVGLWLAGIFGAGGLLVSYLLWSGRPYGRPLAYLLGTAAIFWVILENIVFGPSLVLSVLQMAFCGPQLASAFLVFLSRRYLG